MRMEGKFKSLLLLIFLCFLGCTEKKECSKFNFGKDFYSQWYNENKKTIEKCCTEDLVSNVLLKKIQKGNNLWRQKTFEYLFFPELEKLKIREVLIDETYREGGHLFDYKMVIRVNGHSFRGVTLKANVDSLVYIESPFTKISHIENEDECCHRFRNEDINIINQMASLNVYSVFRVENCELKLVKSIITL